MARLASLWRKRDAGMEWHHPEQWLAVVEGLLCTERKASEERIGTVAPGVSCHNPDWLTWPGGVYVPCTLIDSHDLVEFMSLVPWLTHMTWWSLCPLYLLPCPVIYMIRISVAVSLVMCVCMITTCYVYMYDDFWTLLTAFLCWSWLTPFNTFSLPDWPV